MLVLMTCRLRKKIEGFSINKKKQNDESKNYNYRNLQPPFLNDWS